MRPLDNEFVIESFSSPNEQAYYLDATTQLGLWKSEELIFLKFLKHNSQILDIGCGMGRISFGLYRLGFSNIIGTDVTPLMVENARKLASGLKAAVEFYESDSAHLDFPESRFDAVIYGFNGLMMIPGAGHRESSVKEIYRVLKKDGIFIFTTHDRNAKPEFFNFWTSEKQRWQSNKHDARFDKFGDILFKNKDQIDQFIHIPEQQEILQLLESYGFQLVTKIFRSDIALENQEVENFAAECLFWVFRKNVQ